MKIIFAVNKDLHSNIALNLLKEVFEEHQTYLLLSNKVGNNNASTQIKYLEQDFPNKLLFPNIENESNDTNLRVKNNKYLTFKQISSHYKSPIINFENINSPDALKSIKDIEPDLIISIRYGQIFKEELISIPKHGLINLHSGILPKYKGILTTLRAITNGDQEIGSTLHYIDDAKIDEGSIINISKIPVNKNKSLICHVSSLYNQGTKDILEALNSISATGKVKSDLQDNQDTNYYSHPKEKDLEDFLKTGHKVFDYEEYKDLLRKY